MSSDHLPEGVVSLEEFRSRLSAPADPERPEPFGGYERADYLTWHNTYDTLSILNAGATPGELIIGVRTVSEADVRVMSSKDSSNWGYLVDKSIDDIEALTLDLELGDEEAAARIKDPIERLYVATLVGHHAISRDERIHDAGRLTRLRIGDEVLHVAGERLLDITKWRAAAGLGILAVGAQRPRLRGEMRDYLAETLSNRLEYARSLGRYSVILGRDIIDSEIGDWFIGMCNPLNQIELTTVLSDTQLHAPKSEQP